MRMGWTGIPLLLAAQSIAAVDAASRPNVVMICIDDLNDWVGHLEGHPQVLTPNMDRLAARGRGFLNAHCTVPVCSPSRVSVMSGQHPTTHGSYELGPAYQQMPTLTDVPCLQGWFKRHGYRTITGGKVLHHGFRGRLAQVIDVDWGDGGAGPHPKDGPISWKGNGRLWDWGAFPERDEQTPDMQMATKAAHFLAQAQEQPFFLSVGFHRPHVPLFAPRKWFDLYDPAEIVMPDTAPEDMAHIPPNFQSIPQVAPTLGDLQAAGTWRSMVHAYLACCSFVDHCVGVVLDGLDAGPHRDDTLVVLWSDNGWHLGEKQHVAKRTLWEESTRVPMVWAGPGIPAGPPCREAVSLLDIYPTLVEICGLPENSALEGLSLQPQLRDAGAKRDRPVVSSSYHGNHCVRTRNWRCIRYRDGAEELYHNADDPGEHRNLAGDPTRAERKAELTRWLPVGGVPEILDTLKPNRRARY